MTERKLKVRAWPISITIGYVGQVVAGNGRIIHETRRYFTKARAANAAVRWIERQPVQQKEVIEP